MDFVSDRLRNMRYSKPRVCGVNCVEIGKAVSVQALFQASLNQDPLPSMKSYSFMPADQINLDIRVPYVHSHADLVRLASVHQSYLDDRQKYEEEEEAKRLVQEKEDEKARLIAEYEASKSQTQQPTEGAQ